MSKLIDNPLRVCQIIADDAFAALSGSDFIGLRKQLERDFAHQFDIELRRSSPECVDCDKRRITFSEHINHSMFGREIRATTHCIQSVCLKGEPMRKRMDRKEWAASIMKSGVGALATFGINGSHAETFLMDEIDSCPPELMEPKVEPPKVEQPEFFGDW